MTQDNIEIDGKFYQEAECVLVPTNKGIFQIWNDKLYKPDKLTSGIISYHLYILSTEEISNEDIDKEICIFKSSNGMITCLAGKGIGRVKTMGEYYKIIATNNNNISINLGKEKWVAPTNSNDDMIYTRLCPLPRPSNSFIEAYIREYNKGNQITSILVEIQQYDVKGRLTDEFDIDNFIQTPYTKPTIKVAPDNTITIKKVENKDERMYTKKEAITLAFNAFYQGYKDCEAEKYCPSDIKINFDKFLEQNL